MDQPVDDSVSNFNNSDPEIEELQEKLNLREDRARKWARYIGGVDTSKRQIGKKQSAEYEEKVFKRERLLSECLQRREELRDELIGPLIEWRIEQRGTLIDLDAIQSLMEEFNRRREIVRQHLFPKDDEYARILRELAKVEWELVEFYRGKLKDSEAEFDSKKARIIHLKREFPYSRVSNQLVAMVLDITYSYAQQIKYIPEEGVRDRQVPKHLRNKTLERDDFSCVRCGSTEELEAHHIIPRDRGGDDTLENMATLCHDCHQEAHSKSLPYETQTEFWESWV